MPTYHFIVQRAGRAIQDSHLELADNEAAWEEATTSCGELLKDIDGDLRQGGDLKMVVLDEARAPLFTVRVSSTVHTGDAFP